MQYYAEKDQGTDKRLMVWAWLMLWNGGLHFDEPEARFEEMDLSLLASRQTSHII